MVVICLELWIVDALWLLLVLGGGACWVLLVGGLVLIFWGVGSVEY